MRSLFRATMIWAIVSSMVLCQAQQPPVHLNRHARKIQRGLADYPQGSFLHIVLRDRSDRFGELGKKTPTSFELVDTKTRTPASFGFSEVRYIQVGSTIDDSGARVHWLRRHIVPVAIVTAGAVAAAAIVVVTR